MCNERNISIIEDASESLGTYYKEGNYAGSILVQLGHLGVYHLMVIKLSLLERWDYTTDDEKLAAKPKHLTTQAKDDPVRYRHDENYNRLSNIQAAIGVAQMEQLDLIIERKKKSILIIGFLRKIYLIFLFQEYQIIQVTIIGLIFLNTIQRIIKKKLNILLKLSI